MRLPPSSDTRTEPSGATVTPTGRPHLVLAAGSTTKPRACDELERLRDLPRVLDRRDPPADVLQAGQLDERAFFLDVEHLLELLVPLQLVADTIENLFAVLPGVGGDEDSQVGIDRQK